MTKKGLRSEGAVGCCFFSLSVAGRLGEFCVCVSFCGESWINKTLRGLFRTLRFSRKLVCNFFSSRSACCALKRPFSLCLLCFSLVGESSERRVTCIIVASRRLFSFLTTTCLHGLAAPKPCVCVFVSMHKSTKGWVQVMPLLCAFFVT